MTDPVEMAKRSDVCRDAPHDGDGISDAALHSIRKLNLLSSCLRDLSNIPGMG